MVKVAMGEGQGNIQWRMLTLTSSIYRTGRVRKAQGTIMSYITVIPKDICGGKQNRNLEEL